MTSEPWKLQKRHPGWKLKQVAERTENCNEGIGSGRAATTMDDGSTAKDPEYDDIAAGAISSQVGSKSVGELVYQDSAEEHGAVYQDPKSVAHSEAVGCAAGCEHER